MAVDWKARLLDTKTRSTSPAAAQDAVQQVIADVVAGGVPLSEVKRFVREHRDVFGDDGLQAAKRAAEALLDQTSPKLSTNSLPSQSPVSAGVKAHALRFDPTSALPWFQKTNLPTLPLTLVGPLTGKGEPVVVDGERFSASDVAALLQLAA